MRSFNKQLRRHSVALISLVVALSGLGYNTWRNEQTEANRNVRAAGFELLIKLGELDRVVFFAHYEHDLQLGNLRSGWAYVLTIRDLGKLIPSRAGACTANLFELWQANWTGLEASKASNDTISDAIDECRDDVLEALAALE